MDIDTRDRLITMIGSAGYGVDRYSGRGMYGKECIAVMTDALPLGAMLATSTPHHDPRRRDPDHGSGSIDRRRLQHVDLRRRELQPDHG